MACLAREIGDLVHCGDGRWLFVRGRGRGGSVVVEVDPAAREGQGRAVRQKWAKRVSRVSTATKNKQETIRSGRVLRSLGLADADDIEEERGRLWVTAQGVCAVPDLDREREEEEEGDDAALSSASRQSASQPALCWARPAGSLVTRGCALM